MRRKLFCFSLFLFAACFLISCKKDYPDDIPDWLKREIDQRKRHDGGCCSSCNCGCIKITEYMLYNTYKFYLFECSSEELITFRDIDGHYVFLTKDYINGVWYFANQGSAQSSFMLEYCTDCPPIAKTRLIWAPSVSSH